MIHIGVDLMQKFHERLKYAMNLSGLTQTDLCQKTKIPKSAMSQYISGKFKPKDDRTYLLAKALNVNEAWLMGYNVSMEGKEINKPTDNDRLNEFIELCSQLSDDELDIIETLIDSLLSKHDKED